MASKVYAIVKYTGTGMEYGGTLEVNKLRINREPGTEQEIHLELLGIGYLTEIRLQLTPELAMVLAKSLVSPAEGHVSTTELTLT